MKIRVFATLGIALSTLAFFAVSAVFAGAAAGCADPNAGFRPPVAPADTHAQAKQGESDLTFAKVSGPRAPDGRSRTSMWIKFWPG